MQVLQSVSLPPTAELFSIQELAERHPNLLSEQRLKWAMRNRHQNGLIATGAVFQSRNGTLLIREPAFLAWWLGLSGRSRPRAARR
jgi:hypothetical protein